MVLVVKIGGSAGVATTQIALDIAHYVAEGQRIIVMHGGSDLTNTLCARLNHPVRMITSPNGMTSRYTDAETLSIFAMAVGQMNTELVALLQQHGVNALGLSGIDGRLLVARRKTAIRSVMPDGRTQIIRDDFTGQIETVNGQLLQQLLDSGYMPVVAPLALGHEGERLNVDGDRAAALIAATLQADTLAIMTNVPGLLEDPADYQTLIRSIPADQFATYLPYAQGRMRKKLLGAQEALNGGVRRICIGSGSLLDVIQAAGT
ncbi:MAG TPA: [LysW]-aminoadipate kinase, partial [Ktedonobacteraceae bacterium]